MTQLSHYICVRTNKHVHQEYEIWNNYLFHNEVHLALNFRKTEVNMICYIDNEIKSPSYTNIHVKFLEVKASNHN